MRNKIFLLVMILSLAAGIANAQSKKEAGVASAIEVLKKAMIDGDKTALENLAHEKLSYGHSGGKVEDKASFVEGFASGKSDFVTIDISEQTITVFGKTAIVRHKLNATTNDGGKPGTVKLAIMYVWQQEGKAWKLIARQAVKLT